MTEGGFRHTAGMDAAPESELVIATLDAFDRAFAAGDLDAVVELFTEDASLLLLHGAAVHGRAGIRATWAPTFAKWDMSAWATERAIVDVHTDRAYTLSTYTETLVDRAGTEPSRLVVGRVVMFLQRQDDGRWQISFVMNSHVRPVELLG
jgi:uncharacterized protein (TIGR02246 family)